MNSLNNSNTFEYNGTRYLLHVNLFVSTDRHQLINTLNTEDILTLEYTNCANQLFLTATIDYIDRVGIVDKYLYKNYSYCNIKFAMLEDKPGESFSSGLTVKDMTFIHRFYVQKIAVMNRMGSAIQYKIFLVSVNWLNCMSSLSYTNYGKKPESVIQLIKKMLTLSNLTIDKDTFDKVQTPVTSFFIAQGNDNALTAVKYLLSRLYYYPEGDSSFKFIAYHDLKNQYGMFDIQDKDTFQTVDSIIISMFNTQTEELMNAMPVNMATVTKFPTGDLFKTLYDRKVETYDFQHDKFSTLDKKEKELLDVLNTHFSVNDYEDRFQKRFDSERSYTTCTAYWNSDVLAETYQNVMRTFMEDNSLVLEVGGSIVRKPSSIVMVNVDRQMQMTKEGGQLGELDDIKNKFKAYEGIWVTTKVHHIISPRSDKKYRQNLVLTRNFIPKDVNRWNDLESF